MPRIALLLILTAAAGFAQAKPQKPDHIEMLHQLAAKRKLYWQVACNPESTPPRGREYFATASETNDPSAKLEDGGKGFYFEYGPTQDAAAWNLVQSLLNNNSPTNPAQHREHLQEQARICDPPISGNPDGSMSPRLTSTMVLQGATTAATTGIISVRNGAELWPSPLVDDAIPAPTTKAKHRRRSPAAKP